MGMADGYAIRCMKEISLPEELSFDQKRNWEGVWRWWELWVLGGDEGCE